jgi:hypothetical protein
MFDTTFWSESGGMRFGGKDAISVLRPLAPRYVWMPKACLLDQLCAIKPAFEIKCESGRIQWELSPAGRSQRRPRFFFDDREGYRCAVASGTRA